MTPAVLRSYLCGAFQISEDEGTFLVQTPFGLDSNDSLVLRLRPEGGSLRVDDNGETLLSLSMAGVAPDSDRVLEIANGIEFDEDDGSLIARSDKPDNIADAVFSVVSAALRVHGACRPRLRPVPSDFRERVLAALTNVANESGVSMVTDHLVEQAGNLTVDALLGDATPLLVVAANSVERLMEAELIFLRRQLEKSPGFVCAVVPSAKTIGQKHFSRANYYTDKALEFDEWPTAFHDFVRQRVTSH